jgi:flagellar basal body-associated protein FliL
MSHDVKEKKSQSSKAITEARKQRKSLLVILIIISVLVGLGVYMHLNSEQSMKNTETFFEARKSPETYYEYKEAEESAKKKAERNIFLQN